MRSGAENYKLKITSAVLKVCFVSLHPSVIVAHNEALKLAQHYTHSGVVILKVSV